MEEKHEKENENENKEIIAEKKTNFWTAKHKKGIFEYRVVDLVVLAVMFALFAAYFLAPKAYSVTTARYNAGTQEQNEEVVLALGTERTEEDFRTYFQWYNVIHEMGHGMIRYNSHKKFGNAEEEQLVNDFAVAYWMMYGEADKLERMEYITSHAMNSLQSDAEPGQTYMEFAKARWGKRGFFTFRNYGWFQFSSSNESLKNKKDMATVLREMGIDSFDLPENPEIISYGVMSEEVSDQILIDAVENINSWGVYFPKVYHKYHNNPNDNYSKPVKDLGFVAF